MTGLDSIAKLLFAGCVVRLIMHVRSVARGLSARADGPVNQMAHELPVLRVLRPVLGVVFYLALLDWLLPGTRFPAAYVSVPTPLRFCGALICVLVVEWVGASFRSLGSSYRGGLGLWPDHALTTSGPYGVVRHPIYIGFVTIMVGLAALSANLLLGASGLTLTLSIPVLRVRLEEQQLRDRFGTTYDTYTKRVGRFLPRRRSRVP